MLACEIQSKRKVRDAPRLLIQLTMSLMRLHLGQRQDQVWREKQVQQVGKEKTEVRKTSRQIAGCCLSLRLGDLKELVNRWMSSQ